MLDTPLHVGIEHPNLLWVVAASFLSFLAGTLAGTYADTVREWTSAAKDSAN